MNFPERIAHYLGQRPQVPASAFVAPGAVLVGAVTLGEECSVWYGAVLRGDINSIEVGAGSNIQDGAVLHVADAYGVRLGQRVTVGHRAVVHACRIEDEVLVGMGAIVMDGAVVGARSIIGAGAVVTARTVIPPGSMVLGKPAAVARALTAQEQESIAEWAARYVVLRGEYLRREERIVLSERDFDRFAACITNPQPPTPAFVKARTEYLKLQAEFPDNNL